MSKKTLALLVIPRSRCLIQPVKIVGYAGIRKHFGASARLEGNTLCHVRGDTYLRVWADCEQYMLAPAWVSSFNREMPIHGMALIDAYDITTGEATDCPVYPEALLATIEWEPVKDRLDPDRPNQEWIERFQVENSHADVVVQYGE